MTRTRTRRAGGRWRRPGPVRGARRRPRVANVRWGIGNKKYFSHDADSGVEDFRAALEGFRAVGDRTMEAWSLHMVGGGAAPGPESGGGLDLYLRHALRHFYDAGDAAGITLLLDDLSSQALADDDPIQRGCGAPRGR